jgi:hypothetical protein
MTKILINVSAKPEQKSRLAGVLVQTAQQYSDTLRLNYRDQDTLSAALPELLKQAQREADKILGDSQEN